jgi:lipopolysaccharide/colanic/teichoic acid biosynthesis glycosyltransferase
MMKKADRNQSIIVYETLKREFDTIFCLIALIFAIPIIIAFCIAIMIESPGSCFYSQKRIGKNMRCFTIYKLRSMYLDSEKHGAVWAEKEDPRVTKVGKLMRRTRIDELPQLINILKNDMSLVGPRPERPEFVSEFSKEIPKYKERFKVKSGLTGLAQVTGGYELTPQEKLEKDIYYIKNRSLGLDLLIMIKTIIVVLTGKGAR